MISAKTLIYRAFSFVNTNIRPGNSNTQKNNKKFNWKDAVLDSLIVAGLNFFSTLSAMGAIGLLRDPAQALVGAVISAGFGFFYTLAIKRGLKKA